MSQEEYRKLKEDHDRLKQEFEQLSRQFDALLKEQGRAAPGAAATAPAAQPGDAQAVEKLRQEIQTVKAEVNAAQSGTSKFLIAGSAMASYANPQDGTSSFGAGFDPLVFFVLNDRVIFGSELEIELADDGETEVALEYAQIAYRLGEHGTVIAGKFLNPSSYFAERLHPSWINKLPDSPLFLEGETALQAESQVGLQVRGAALLGSARMGYAVYVSNGPQIRSADDENAGTLDFENYTDLNNDKALGGRISFAPFPYLEIGYGYERADVEEPGQAGISAVTQVVDLNYARSVGALGGNIDFRLQNAWLDIDNPGEGALTFRNDREGGYAQFAYRPTLVSMPYLRDTEVVLRYDWMGLPSGAPSNTDEHRWTAGLDYWLTPSTVFKAAYEFDRRQGAADNDAFLMQFGTGF